MSKIQVRRKLPNKFGRKLARKAKILGESQVFRRTKAFRRKPGENPRGNQLESRGKPSEKARESLNRK
jgi:hypothetical protein